MKLFRISYMDYQNDNGRSATQMPMMEFHENIVAATDDVAFAYWKSLNTYRLERFVRIEEICKVNCVVGRIV